MLRNSQLSSTVLVLCLLSACAPDAETPTADDARIAMKARMENSKSADVKVTELRELALSGCAPAPSDPGVICEVQMDVVFTVDGLPNRSNDRDRMRFVHEPEGWKAYPVASGARPAP